MRPVEALAAYIDAHGGAVTRTAEESGALPIPAMRVLLLLSHRPER